MWVACGVWSTKQYGSHTGGDPRPEGYGSGLWSCNVLGTYIVHQCMRRRELWTVLMGRYLPVLCPWAVSVTLHWYLQVVQRGCCTGGWLVWIWCIYVQEKVAYRHGSWRDKRFLCSWAVSVTILRCCTATCRWYNGDVVPEAYGYHSASKGQALHGSRGVGPTPWFVRDKVSVRSQYKLG